MRHPLCMVVQLRWTTTSGIDSGTRQWQVVINCLVCEPERGADDDEDWVEEGRN